MSLVSILMDPHQIIILRTDHVQNKDKELHKKGFIPVEQEQEEEDPLPPAEEGGTLPTGDLRIDSIDSRMIYIF